MANELESAKVDQVPLVGRSSGWRSSSIPQGWTDDRRKRCSIAHKVSVNGSRINQSEFLRKTRNRKVDRDSRRNPGLKG